MHAKEKFRNKEAFRKAELEAIKLANKILDKDQDAQIILSKASRPEDRVITQLITGSSDMEAL
jgi:hypothetical protein